MTPDIEARVRERLTYEPNTGILRWTELGFKPGEPAGYVWKAGRRHINICGKCLKAHRVAWFLYYGRWPTDTIDHINGNQDDNRIENLRDCSRTEQNRNLGRCRRNTSGVTGVNRVYGLRAVKWEARIRGNGKQVRFGPFDNIEDAIAARKQAERDFGYHPNHGRAA